MSEQPATPTSQGRPSGNLAAAQARYRAMGLSTRQAKLLARIDHLRESGVRCMLLVNPDGLTWQFWRVTPDGMAAE